MDNFVEALKVQVNDGVPVILHRQSVRDPSAYSDPNWYSPLYFSAQFFAIEQNNGAITENNYSDNIAVFITENGNPVYIGYAPLYGIEPNINFLSGVCFSKANVQAKINIGFNPNPWKIVDKTYQIKLLKMTAEEIHNIQISEPAFETLEIKDMFEVISTFATIQSPELESLGYVKPEVTDTAIIFNAECGITRTNQMLPIQ